MHNFNRVWKPVAVGVALAVPLFAAEMKFNFDAYVNSASQQPTKIKQGIGIETIPIVGSDATVSTYGLDSARTFDW
jgi:hypothetical protein